VQAQFFIGGGALLDRLAIVDEALILGLDLFCMVACRVRIRAAGLALLVFAR